MTAHFGTPTDTVNFDDTPSGFTQYGVAVTDDVIFNDIESNSVATSTSVQDDVTFADVLQINLPVELTDDVTFDDTVTFLAITAFTDTPQDDVTFDDVLKIGFGVALVDDFIFDEKIHTDPQGDIEFDDSPIAGLGVAVSDQHTFDDSLVPGLGVSPIDDVTFDDVPAPILVYGIPVTDDFTIDDTPAPTLAYGVPVTDDVTFADALSAGEFLRTILPRNVSDLWSPGALKDMSPSGLLQIRATKSVGWSWKESWGPLSVKNAEHLALIMFIKSAWNRGLIFDATHAMVPGSGIAPNGLGTAGILVNGASQTGEELITDGWPINTVQCVRAGDAIKIAGDNAVYIVTDDANSDGLGEVLIPINPPLRLSPLDNANVTTTDVSFKAVIMSNSQKEKSRPSFQFEGISIVMTEVL